jgi:tRNA(Ile)-lysidine synthase
MEELARKKRYEFLRMLKEKHNADYIITGHHLDDRIETLFFNMVRGSKITGLINMTEVSGDILRPLIQAEKKDIVAYLKENKLQYFEDKSNKDNTITRNKLRNEILPNFENINSRYKQNINNLLKYFEDLKYMIDFEVKNFL